MRLAPKIKAEKRMPIAREIPLDADTLLQVLLSLDPARRVSILDSGGSRGHEARFLIAGFDPFEVVEAWGDHSLISREGESIERLAGGDALRALDERLERHRVPPSREASWPVAGACIATFSYDLVRRFERLRSRPCGATGEPDAVLAFYDTLVIHDYARGTTAIVSVAGPERLTKIHDAINGVATNLRARTPGRAEAVGCALHPLAHPSMSDLPLSFSHPALTSNFTRDEYIAAIQRIKERIAAGDIYQANLTQQLSIKVAEDLRPEHIFLRLRGFHPASFAAFIRRREDVVISASPERFLRVEAGGSGSGRKRRVEAWPIKGTRARGRNAEEDARLRAELYESEKDRAENVMIVDLLRNDLGRVCEYGSVEVPELYTVQEHPTLFHLVSKVRGRLRDDVTATDLLRAAFPCGSVTGAPKIRAIEIIDEIETAPRGLSMGAIGYFSFDGALDLSVAIRTMTVSHGAARFNVGGGIVADSDPALEYEESLVKARALLRALDISES
jgi:para-aminobenzoate synthetase component I